MAYTREEIKKHIFDSEKSMAAEMKTAHILLAIAKMMYTDRYLPPKQA